MTHVARRTLIVVPALFCLLILSGFADRADAASLTSCAVRGSESGLAELKAKRIKCEAARGVYSASLRAAKTGELPLVFEHGGRQWTCKASNPKRVIDGTYVDYQWRCTSGNHLVRYRWLAGD